MFSALAIAHIRNRPLQREELVSAVAYALANGDMAAADYLGGFLSRRDFATAHCRAAQLGRTSRNRVARPVSVWQWMFRCISRCVGSGRQRR